MKSCLIICWGTSCLAALEKFKNYHNVVVASDDLHVQEFAKKAEWVNEVSFIEKGESLFAAALDVKRIIREIDEWLQALNPSASKEVMTWGAHIEGGLTSQRVQDAILLIRSYHYLFSTYNVREVHTIAQAGREL